MEEKINNLIIVALKNLEINSESSFVVEHPADLAMGDYSTNVAMALAKNLKTNPKELAEKIVNELNKNKIQDVGKIAIAGPGFINFYLSPEFFANSISEIITDEKFGKNNSKAGQVIMVEYTDPNPFKPFHIGHLMSNSIGEAISRLVEYSGAETIRANYQGDVGLHVAKAIYGLQKKGLPEESKTTNEKAEYIGQCYSFASNLYEEDEDIKKEINLLNKKIYEKSDEKINELYLWGRIITLEAFEDIYKKLGTKFKHYFFESEMAELGKKIVKENTEQNGKQVFEESNGAIVFHGEKYDPKLHTRVFINSEGLPTYETKEIGLTVSKFEKENPDTSIVITAIEQGEYMKVVQKAISLIHPDYESRMKHITHGMLRFSTGKMSSRKGNIITGESLILDVEQAILEKVKDRDFNEEEKKNIATMVGVGALKYSILKQSAGADIIYDFEKSISFEGDSGPYLQYTYARAKSVLEKVDHHPASSTPPPQGGEEKKEPVYEIEKLLYQFPEVVLRATQNFEPHHIANYLIEVARSFNAFYGTEKIIGGENEAYKLAITSATATVLKNGLYLLGIEAPEKM